MASAPGDHAAAQETEPGSDFERARTNIAFSAPTSELDLAQQHLLERFASLRADPFLTPTALT
jgi:hypothetical protein